MVVIPVPGCGHHERPHHLVVLVLDDVAVPYVQTRDVEHRLYAGDLARIGDYRVFVTRLPELRTLVGPSSSIGVITDPRSSSSLSPWRSITWNRTRCRWIGCASAVALKISQVS